MQIHEVGDVLETKRKEATDRFEKRGDAFWSYDGIQHPKHPKSYEMTFEGLLDGQETFNELIEQRKKSGLQTRNLDVLGSGVHITEYDYVDAIIGLRLKDVPRDMVILDNEPEYRVMGQEEPIPIPSKEELIAFREKVMAPEVIKQDQEKRSVVEANIFDATKSIRALKEEMQRREVEEFDIITLRGLGGILFKELRKADEHPPIEAYRDTMYLLLNRIYKLTTNEQGLIFIDPPSKIFSKELIQEWAEGINQADLGILVETNERGVLKIIKLSDAPDNLPPI